MPVHLRRDDVRSLVDQRDFNLTFSSTEEMLQRASEYLPPGTATKFRSLTEMDLAAIDAWQALRNFLAHRSRSSSDRMNHALENPHLDIRLRRGKHRIYSVGSFLSSIPSGTTRWRVLEYLDAMESVASRL